MTHPVECDQTLKIKVFKRIILFFSKMFCKRKIERVILLLCLIKYAVGSQERVEEQSEKSLEERGRNPARTNALYLKAMEIPEYPRLYKKETDRVTWEMFVDLLWYTDYTDQKSVIDSRSIISKPELIIKYDTIEINPEKRKENVKAFYEKYFVKEKKESYTDKPTEEKIEEANSEPMNYKIMNSGIREMWKKFIREPEEEKEMDKLDSRIRQNNTVVVPGGRFQEAYYWDFYWMAKGLYISKLDREVEGMKKNYMDQIEQFGFIPNGTRWYYTNRSQPPYFIQILVDSMDSIKRIRKDAQSKIKRKIKKNTEERIREEQSKKIRCKTQPLVEKYKSKSIEEIDTVLTDREICAAEKEFEFWDKRRTVTVEVPVEGRVEKHRLSRYSAEKDVPRPEMLLADLESHENHRIYYGKKKNDTSYYRDIVAGTESGWDFSKRWRKYDEKRNIYGFLQTNSIIPVDLNSILVKNARILERLYKNRKNKEKEEKYRIIAEERSRAIDAVLWDPEYTRWRDVIIHRKIETEKEKDSKLDSKSGSSETETDDSSDDSSLFSFTRKMDSAFYHSDLHPLYMDIVDDPDNSVLDANESEMWINSGKFLLPCTSTHTRSTEKKENPSSSSDDLLQQENNKIDQWDGWSIWPPLVQLTIEYLIRSDNMNKAVRVYHSYISQMHAHYSSHGSLPEKIEYTGHGTGEYSVQEGFGWSNGVAQWIYYVFNEGKKEKENNQTVLADKE